MRVHLIGQLTPDSSPATLQFCGPVSCGFPSPAADYQEPDLSLDKLVGIGPTSSIFLFRAFGDSMIGAGISWDESCRRREEISSRYQQAA